MNGSSCVYFIRCGEFVKIGTSYDVGDRIRALQTGNPYPLELLGTVPGDDKMERRIHKACKSVRHMREWFHYTPSLQGFIVEMCRLDAPHSCSTQLLPPDVEALVEEPQGLRTEARTRRLINKTMRDGLVIRFNECVRLGKEAESAYN